MSDQEWLPIESAPNDGTEVLVTGHNFDDPQKGRWRVVAIHAAGIWCLSEGETLYRPTHWMPLPNPPEDNP